ncbi:MAG: hypothetical protein ABIC95_01155 [archaeon]
MDIKKRIKQPLDKRGDMFWVIIMGIIALVVLVVLIIINTGLIRDTGGAVHGQIDGTKDCDMDGVPNMLDRCCCCNGADDVVGPDGCDPFKECSESERKCA